ncbi:MULTISPECIES: O-fucosyltransferase family protein [unclassified Sutcliffiella]|uniref:O-fucosyltransferase family protein n=1 Tax=unclassified Sutcliffiella TaxID=2837532 RepID=UPI0030D5F8FB
MAEKKYLLIKAWGAGFWSDIEHVMGQMLFSEISGRIPIVYWGEGSNYASDNPIEEDAFSLFFKPLSQYKVNNIENKSLSFYPKRFKFNNLRSFMRRDKTEKNITADWLKKTENVIVSRHHCSLNQLRKIIPEGNKLFHKSNEEIYSYLYKKYLKILPTIQKDIDTFESKNFKNKHILAVHIRGTDKIAEVPNLLELHQQFPQAINDYFKMQPTAYLFLMTESQEILNQYKNLYGSKLIYTKCLRISNNDQNIYKINYSKNLKGREILIDTILATKCNYFIGSNSNVTNAVIRLGNWSAKKYRLIK